jgi:hypothetical protein
MKRMSQLSQSKREAFEAILTQLFAGRTACRISRLHDANLMQKDPEWEGFDKFAPVGGGQTTLRSLGGGRSLGYVGITGSILGSGFKLPRQQLVFLRQPGV